MSLFKSYTDSLSTFRGPSATLDAGIQQRTNHTNLSLLVEIIGYHSGGEWREMFIASPLE